MKVSKFLRIQPSYWSIQGSTDQNWVIQSQQNFENLGPNRNRTKKMWIPGSTVTLDMRNMNLENKLWDEPNL